MDAYVALEAVNFLLVKVARASHVRVFHRYSRQNDSIAAAIADWFSQSRDIPD